jgi:hypothetical protein
MSRSRSRLRLERATPAMPLRSWAKSALAQVQPLFSSWMRFSTGTLTLSRKTSLTSWPPSRVMIGRTVIPGEVMSISRKLIPDCGLDVGSVRTRKKPQSANWASVVQVFWPLTM